ncbi:MAG TPA: O-antigen ligase family protein [Terriglobales bacterium]|nr:O-antigen ligase family protein [Terriglobales bacterium]
MNLIRGGLLFLFAFSVLAFGAVEIWSGSIVEIGASLLFIGWAVLVLVDDRIKIYWSPLNGPLLLLFGIGLAQLLLRATPYPFLTRVELLKLAAYLLIFFLSTQVFRERRDLTNLVWFLILLCFSVSLLGIVQHFTSDAKIYGFRTLTAGGDPFGPFVNRNHFAGFVELTLPAGLALLIFRGLRRDMIPLTGLLTIVPVGAMILSGSRGGIVSFGFEVAVLALLARLRKAPEGPRLVALAIVGFAALALVAWLGTGRALERFSTLHPGDVTLSRRATMVHGAAHIFFDHPIIGAGLGSLVAVYPRYETVYDGHIVDHVHNDFMELLAEMGMLGGLCGLAFLWILVREARNSFTAEQGHFSRGIHAGAIAALCGLLLHSLVDFNLHIPSNALLFLLQSYLATSAPLPSEAPMKRQRTRSREHAPLDQ